MNPFYFNSPFAEKCWIRRHKILAIIAPFLLLRWIPGHGIGGALGEFLMALFLFELWSLPFAAFLAFATILFFAGRIIWKRSRTWPFRLLGIVLAYIPIALCAMIPLFRYVGP